MPALKSYWAGTEPGPMSRSHLLGATQRMMSRGGSLCPPAAHAVDIALSVSMVYPGRDRASPTRRSHLLYATHMVMRRDEHAKGWHRTCIILM